MRALLSWIADCRHKFGCQVSFFRPRAPRLLSTITAMICTLVLPREGRANMSGTFETIDWRESGRVAHLTFNRPESRNGIVRRMLIELHEALDRLRARTDISVLVLSGAGGDFCPGMDLRAKSDGSETPVALFDVATLLHELPIVTIAAIRGACAGAGLTWAAACDLRYASDTARFNTAFLDVGLAGDMGGPWTLPRIIGAARARELYFMPGKFDAAEAERIGLVSRVFSDMDLDDQVTAIAGAIGAKAPATLRMMKENFLAAEQMDFASFIPFEAERHTASARTPDSREARAAFIEKRPPRFA
ncbi:MAG: enoyl-CoA hydratase-related protein [Sphingomonas bacterium]